MCEKISVILSCYNESIDMVCSSIDSIIAQTYTNIEILLINDNPDREELHILLSKYKERDSRIKYVRHTTNLGLVKTLNEGIELASGKFIARMDADDVSEKNRLFEQINFMTDNKYDIVGCNIEKIDEQGKIIGQLRLPTYHEKINKYMNYGSCVLHPTWLVKKEVYISLCGYRNIPSCEDYDFLLRALQKGYKMGNAPIIGLKYRIRMGSISNSTSASQKIIMYYLQKNRKLINSVSEDKIIKYMNTTEYNDDVRRMSDYEKHRKGIIEGKTKSKLKYVFLILFNKYFYKSFFAHVMMKKREHYSYMK